MIRGTGTNKNGKFLMICLSEADVVRMRDGYSRCFNGAQHGFDGTIIIALGESDEVMANMVREANPDVQEMRPERRLDS